MSEFFEENLKGIVRVYVLHWSHHIVPGVGEREHGGVDRLKPAVLGGGILLTEEEEKAENTKNKIK
jgi:hypothetical protein